MKGEFRRSSKGLNILTWPLARKIKNKPRRFSVRVRETEEFCRVKIPLPQTRCRVARPKVTFSTDEQQQHKLVWPDCFFCPPTSQTFLSMTMSVGGERQLTFKPRKGHWEIIISHDLNACEITPKKC